MASSSDWTKLTERSSTTEQIIRGAIEAGFLASDKDGDMLHRSEDDDDSELNMIGAVGYTVQLRFVVPSNDDKVSKHMPKLMDEVTSLGAITALTPLLERIRKRMKDGESKVRVKVPVTHTSNVARRHKLLGPFEAGCIKKAYVDGAKVQARDVNVKPSATGMLYGHTLNDNAAMQQVSKDVDPRGNEKFKVVVGDNWYEAVEDVLAQSDYAFNMNDELVENIKKYGKKQIVNT
jgi:hypothetical protein